VNSKAPVALYCIRRLIKPPFSLHFIRIFVFSLIFLVTTQFFGINLTRSPRRIVIKINIGSVTGDAGSPIKQEYITDDDITLSIDDVSNRQKWKITARRIDVNWSGNFALFVKRINNGTANPGKINGGEAFLEIEPFDRDFFTGKGNIYDIGIQYKLFITNFPIYTDRYKTKVVFTVTEY